MTISRLAQAMAFTAVMGISSTAALAESSNSVTFEGWANDTATQYNGRIPRDVYLDEMSRRWDLDRNHRGTRDAYVENLRRQWDATDRDNRGMTPADVSRLTGKVDSSTSALPRSGSGVQPGNMGPANSKGK